MRKLKILLILVSWLAVSCEKETSTPEPVADFTISKTTAEIGETISFTNSSENATTYEWSFGDGSSSIDENPTHTYSSIGTYTVKLTATGEGGENSVTKNIEITIPINIIPGVGAMDIAITEPWLTASTKIGTDHTQYDPMVLDGGYIVHPIASESKGILLFLLSVNSSATLINDDIVFLIALADNFVGQTSNKIMMGSSLSEVASAYGVPTEDDTENNAYFYDNIGIGFHYNGVQIIDEMMIYLPDTKKSNWISAQDRTLIINEISKQLKLK